MKLKYGDLISANISAKLGMISFSTPQKNLEMYKFITSIAPMQDFFEAERIKLLKKYGTHNEDGSYIIQDEPTARAYQEELAKILDMDISNEIYCPDISEDDFSCDLCEYPKDKALWMNAHNIGAVMTLVKKLKT